MKPEKTMVWPARLLLVVLLGLLSVLSVVVAGVSLHVHAAAGATLTVTDCGGQTGPGRIGTVINSASAGDTIGFSCSGPIPIGSTLVISTNHLTLDGSGQSVTLDGGSSTQVLSVSSGVSFTLNAITIAHGSATSGGGLYNNGGTVSINNSTFANNAVVGIGLGGGLDNVSGGTVSISDSTFANNTASGLGGGLYNGGGTVNISNSTFFGNTRAFEGGGLYNGGTLSISNSTFANNTAYTAGGLSNVSGGTLSISNSTFANTSGTGYDELSNRGTLSIGGSIVATSCYSFPQPISDQGYNLESGTTCGFTGTGDLQHTNPLLASALANNGGPTQTLALLDGSPAIDHIPAAHCPATDQRGVTRPDDNEATCDIGAYEATYPPDHDLGLTNLPTNITTDATAPNGAVVTYAPPTAVDESGDTPAPAVTCSPASGSTFAIGSTTVTCTATDSDDLNSPVSQSFTVVVNGAATQLSNLIATVNGFHLPQGIQTSFDSQLQAVLADLNAGKTSQACSDLTGFINHVQAQSGKALTVRQASQLIAAAQQIKTVLSC